MNPTKEPLRAAIYARISQDDSGKGAGVARQLEDGRALAASRGWEVVGEFTDNDVSAYTGANRPGYTALMAAVEAREVDRIVVYMTSRLWRSRKDRASAMETLERLRVGIAPVSGTELDFATASGRMVAGILGEFDTAESAVKSERVSRASDQRAREGRPSGDLGYGWRALVEFGEDGKPKRPATYVLDDDEAPIVREVVERLTAGETLDGVCRDLNARGVPSPGAGHDRRYRSPENPDGSLWVSSGLRKTALRPSNAALRVHRGEVVGAAAWPAIITEDAHRRVVEVLTDPRRQSNGGNAVRRHLLSFGIGRCGVCGSRLRVSPKGGHALYVCDAPSGCIGRRQERVDEFVEAVVVERLKRDDVSDLLAPVPIPGVDPDAAIVVATLRKRLDDAAALYAEGKIDADQLEKVSTTLRPKIDTAERASRPVVVTPPPKALARMTGHRDARAVWERLDVVTKRQVLDALGVTVTINKTRQGPGFDPESVVIEWGRT